MAKGGDNIGRVSVKVTPDFDQKALTRQVEQASKKLPKLKLDVKITAASVNAAVREVNRKKLTPLKLPVEITVREVNKAVREANRKNFTKLKVKMDVDNKPLKQSVKQGEREIGKLEKAVNKFGKSYKKIFQTREIGEFAASFILVRSAVNQIRLASLVTAFGFLAEAASAASAAVVQLTGALSFGAIGGIGVATSGVLALGQALGVVRLAFGTGANSLIGAVGGLNRQLDPKKFNRLTPAAKEFALSLESIKAEVRGLQNVLQQNLFKGLSQALSIAIPLAEKLAPSLEQTATILGNLGLIAARALKPLSGQLQIILATNNILISNLGQGIINLGDSFIRLTAAVAPFSVQISKTILQTTVAIRNFIAVQEATGGLSRFFEHSTAVLRVFTALLVNTGKILVGIFRASLPFGIAMLVTLDRLSGRLAEIINSTKGQASIARFFKSAQAPLREFGLLVRDLAKDFFQLAQQPGLVTLLQDLRTKLLPTLVPAIEKITSQLGPKLVETFTQIITLFARLASAGGPVNIFVTAVGKLVGKINEFIDLHPRLSSAILGVVGGLAVLEAGFAAVKLSIFVTRMSGVGIILSGIFSQLLRVSAGMLGFSIAAQTAAGKVGLAIRGLLASIGPLILAIGGVVVAFTLAWQHSETFRKACQSLSDQILNNNIPVLHNFTDSFKDLTVWGSNVILTLTGIKKAATVDSGFALVANQATQFAKKLGGGGIAKPKKLTEQQKFINDVIKQSKELNKAFKSIAVPADIGKEANDAAAGIRNLNSATKAAANIALDKMKTQLQALEGPLQRQKDLIDSLTNAINDLKNVQLAGTKAFDDQRFALDQQTKALQLQQVQLQLNGAQDGDPRLAAIQKQLDQLQLQAQQTDLQESLQLDPLRRKLDETFNPIKELSFDNIIAQFKRLTARHDFEAKKLTILQTGYDALKAKIDGVTQAAKKLSHEFSLQIANLPKDATSGGAAAGQALIAGLGTGISSQLQSGTDFHKTLKQIEVFIRENKGPVEHDRTILVPAGMAIMDGLNTGLQRGFEPVKSYLKRVGPSMEEFVPDSMFSKRTAEFLVEVAAGKKPDPNKFFGDLVPNPIGLGGGITDPRLGFLHKTLSLADTAFMAKSLAKTFGMQVTALGPAGASAALGLPGHNTFTATGNISDHTRGLAADISNGILTPQEDALARALKPLIGVIVKQLIWRNQDQATGAFIPNHMNHVHVAFLPAKGFNFGSGKIGHRPAATPFAALFAAAAAAYNLSPELLQAVAKIESGFNPRATSGAGAKGLMQLLPSTFASQGVGNNIFDPRQNIFAGAHYLKTLLKRFNGNIPLALAGYNAGPGAAHLALNSFSASYVSAILKLVRTFGGFRARGGSTLGGSSYIVGERGPELWMERKPGFIMSNRDMKEMLSLLREIRDTGGLRQQTTNIQTASQDPQTIIALMEAKKRRKLSRVKL